MVTFSTDAKVLAGLWLSASSQVWTSQFSWVSGVCEEALRWQFRVKHRNSAMGTVQREVIGITTKSWLKREVFVNHPLQTETFQMNFTVLALSISFTVMQLYAKILSATIFFWHHKTKKKRLKTMACNTWSHLQYHCFLFEVSWIN